MDPMTITIVVMVVATALIFDFTNGFHDTANAMATSIATGALKPKTAVIAAGTLNLVGAFLSTEVAKTISGGIINEQQVTIGAEFIFAGLVGAILWNLITWLVGLPSSSSHALFGGLVGAVIVGAGVQGVNFGAVAGKVLIPALVSPLVAGLASWCAVKLIYRIVAHMDEKQVASGFRHGQTVTACLVALSHGTNDAQKTMGIITLTLVASGLQASGTGPELWVVAVCGLAIALGTLLPRTWDLPCPPRRCAPVPSLARGWAPRRRWTGRWPPACSWPGSSPSRRQACSVRPHALLRAWATGAYLPWPPSRLASRV